MIIIRRIVVLCAAVFFATALFGVGFTRNFYSTGNRPQTVVFADINRDGYPDLIVGDESKYLTVLLGKSGGTFTINSNIGLISAPIRLVTGDFNGDGYPDVAVLEDGWVEILISAKNGALVHATGSFSFEGKGVEMVAIDLNGDHNPDLALARCDAVGCALDTFIDKPSSSVAHFTRVWDQGIPRTTRNGLVAADFNRDGHDDLAVQEGALVRILRSLNNGTFTAVASIAPPTESSGFFYLAAGDIDAANGPDLVMQSIDACGPDCNDHSSLWVYLNNGSGTLVHKSTLDMGNMAAGRNVLADITGDNRLDVVHINESPLSGELAYATYKGGGAFNAKVIVRAYEFPNDIAVRDFNLDSRHDLAITDLIAPGTSTERNTTATVICAPPKASNLAAKMCTPSTSSTGSRTFTVRGSGNSPAGVRRVELWVDGVKKYDSPDDQLRRTITLTAGTHRLVVQAVDQFGTTAKVTKYVTVP